MNRNLREVRRYWPRARAQWSYTTSTRFVVPGSGGVWITVYPDGATVTIDTVMSGRMRYSGRTIPEAMRAAGVGRRELTDSELWREVGWMCLSRKCRNGACRCHVWLTVNQRPRKGARLGKRKRARGGQVCEVRP